MTFIKRGVFMFLLIITSSLLAQPASETASVETPKSASEIIREIEEEAKKYTDSEKLPDEAASEASSDKNLEEIVSESPDDFELASDTEKMASTDDNLLPENQVHAVSIFEKPDSLEPLLILNGKPVDEVNEISSITRISGKLQPEKKFLARRKFVYRWVLKTADAKLIPLKSNLKLLQEVKKESNLDGFVTLTGKFVASGFKNELKYFVVESLTAVDELPVMATASENSRKSNETDNEIDPSIESD